MQPSLLVPCSWSSFSQGLPRAPSVEPEPRSLRLGRRRQPLPRRAPCRVRFLVLDHVPDDRRQTTHHCHPGDLRPSTPLDPAVPRLHPCVTPQDVHDQLPEDEAGHGAALLGNRAQAIGRLAGVAAAGRQAPVVGQTARPRKPLDRADPRGQRQAGIGPAAGNRRHWERAWRWPRFRAVGGPRCGADDRPWLAGRAESPGSARGRRRGACGAAAVGAASTA